MKKKLSKIILEVAIAGSRRQRKDGSMIPGKNGPWNDLDTPVRNTANWLKIFLYCYKNCKDAIFLESGKKCFNYLISEEAIPHQLAFYCRKNTNKNNSNGLIGQAWVIESLHESIDYFDKKKSIDLINKVASAHEYDSEKHLWKEMMTDGSEKKICSTFNQQLWFGITLFRARKFLTKKNKKNIDDFLKNIKNTISTYESGMILHPIIFPNIKNAILKRVLKKIKIKFDKKIKSKKIIDLSIGYNLFNIYALAMLKETGVNYIFLNSRMFKKILNYSLSENFTIKLNKNIYSYQYNAPGFEIPIILNSFFNNKKKVIEISKPIIQRQFDLTFDEKNHKFSKNTCDPETLTARLYELTRLPREILNKIEINI